MYTEVPAPEPTPEPNRLAVPTEAVFVTYVLIGINAIVYVLDMLTGAEVRAWGALMPVLVIDLHEWWRVLTSGFLHGSLTHIAFNLYALYGLGQLAERFFGPRRFLVIYGLALLGGSTLVTAFSPLQVYTVGASGAILGVLGALVVYYGRYRDVLVGGAGYLNELLKMAGINLLIGLLPGISMWGHLGGFVAGAMIGWALLPRYRRINAWSTLLSLQPLSTSNLGMAFAILIGWCLALVACVWLRGGVL